MLGAANAGTIMKGIERSRTLPLERWIFAIGIPGVGSTVAADLAGYHKDFADFAASELIREANRLYDLMAEADRNNPSTQRVRALDVSDRVACAERFTVLSEEIHVLGTALAEKGWATRLKSSSFKFSCVVKPEACRAIHAFFQSEPGQALIASMAAHNINPQPRQSRHPVGETGILPSAAATFLAGSSLSLPDPFKMGSPVMNYRFSFGKRVAVFLKPFPKKQTISSSVKNLVLQKRKKLKNLVHQH